MRIRTPAPTDGMGSQICTLLSAAVLLAVSTTVIGTAGVSIVFTYLVPLLTDVTALPAVLVPMLLLVYGVSGFVGNLIAGCLAGLSLGLTLVGIFLSLAATLAILPLVASHAIPMVGLVIVLGLLLTVTDYGTPEVLSSLNISGIVTNGPINRAKMPGAV